MLAGPGESQAPDPGIPDRDAELTATESGTGYPRWTFPDGSAVVLGQCTWQVV